MKAKHESSIRPAEETLYCLSEECFQLKVSFDIMIHRAHIPSLCPNIFFLVKDMDFIIHIIFLNHTPSVDNVTPGDKK